MSAPSLSTRAARSTELRAGSEVQSEVHAGKDLCLFCTAISSKTSFLLPISSSNLRICRAWLHVRASVCWQVRARVRGGVSGKDPKSKHFVLRLYTLILHLSLFVSLTCLSLISLPSSCLSPFSLSWSRTSFSGAGSVARLALPATRHRSP